MIVKHAYESTKAPSDDPSIIDSAKWNDDHIISDVAIADVGGLVAALAAKIETSVIDNDATFTANSTTRLPTQQAVKTALAAKIDTSVIDNDATFAANSASRLATQQAVKAYVDALLAGLSWKRAVRAATTANGTLATAFANGQVIDGVTLATGDRILLKNQTAAADNGIYVVAATGAPSRALDADAGGELVNATVYVSEGTTNADTQWTCGTNAPITAGTTSLTFVQLSSGGASWGGIGGTLSAQSDLVAALALKATLASPALTGTPTAPTAAVGTSTTQLATTEFVRTPSVQSVTSASTVTPSFASDLVKVTAQAAALTIANPTGTAVELGFVIRIKDNGTARAITYGTQYRGIGLTLPASTVAGKTLYMGCIWNNDDSKVDVVAACLEV